MARLRTVQAYDDDAVCSINGCDKPPRARGWCTSHYNKWQRYGDPEIASRVGGRVRNDGPCSVEGCDRGGRRRKGLCPLHYNRWLRHGDALYERPGRQREPRTSRVGKKRAAEPRRVLVPRDVPINSWADAERLDEPVSHDARHAILGMARSEYATTYVDGNMTAEQVVNGVYCPTCGAEATRLCRHSAYGEPVARNARDGGEIHPARIAAAQERFGTRKRA